MCREEIVTNWTKDVRDKTDGLEEKRNDHKDDL